MFYSYAIPAILQTQSVAEKPARLGPGKKAHASMSVEQPAEQSSAEAGQSTQAQSTQDVALTLHMLYEQFRRPIHSYVYRLLGNLEDADDITQEVFVRACTSWHGLYERERLSPWLYRIATNLCVDQLRRRKRLSWWPLSQRFRRDENGEEIPYDDVSLLLADSGGIPEVAEREHIRMALKKLPEDYAIALVLSAAQGIPYQEIAQIVGISPNAAATRISRAKKMFVEQYQRISKDDADREEKQR